MVVVRQAGVLLLAALISSRGLFAQDGATRDSLDQASPSVVTTTAADEVKVLLRPVEIRYVQQEDVLLPRAANIKGLYVNAWAFGSSKLWQLVRLADETEVNAFVIDVKDDTGCLLYPSSVPTAQQIGANNCVRAKDARARLDTLATHRIYTIARIVLAKGPPHAQRKPGWAATRRHHRRPRLPFTHPPAPGRPRAARAASTRARYCGGQGPGCGRSEARLGGAGGAPRGAGGAPGRPWRVCAGPAAGLWPRRYARSCRSRASRACRAGRVHLWRAHSCWRRSAGPSARTTGTRGSRCRLSHR